MSEAVRFRPRAITQLGMWALLVFGGSNLLLAYRQTSGPPLAELHCSRTTHECKEHSSDAFGLTDDYTYGFKLLTNSRVEQIREGTEWVVTDGDTVRSLGGATRDAAQAAEYRRLAAGFEDFLTDPHRDRFDAVYQAVGMSLPLATIFLAVLAIGALYLAFSWWRGWVADLCFDRAAGTVTIDRRPMFFTGKRRMALHLAQLVPVFVEEDRAQTFLGRYGPIKTVKFVRIELRDREGTTYFSYAMPYDDAGKPAADQRIASVRSYFT